MDTEMSEFSVPQALLYIMSSLSVPDEPHEAMG